MKGSLKNPRRGAAGFRFKTRCRAEGWERVGDAFKRLMAQKRNSQRCQENEVVPVVPTTSPAKRHVGRRGELNPRFAKKKDSQ